MNYRILNEAEIQKWDDFVHSSRMGMIYQTWDWGNLMMRAQKWTPQILVMEENGKIKAGALIAYKRLPLLNKTTVRIPRGFVWQGDLSQEIMDNLLESFEHFTRQVCGLSCTFGICLPEIINLSKNEQYHLYDEWIMANKKILKVPALDGRSTFWIDLTQSEDKIWGNINRDYRYNINKSQKTGVVVGFSEDDNLLDLFYNFYSKMFERKGIESSGYVYFDQGVRKLIQNKKCRIFYAKYNDKIINIVIISLIGIPRYIWGAVSTEDDRLPPSGHLIQWEIIKWLKSQNYQIYDLGGTPGYNLDKKHPNYGVWFFKKRFGGDYVEFFGDYDLVVNRPLYQLYQKILPAYKRTVKIFKNKQLMFRCVPTPKP
ncbi:MAG: peptidoglycan bridge formation glycyltransferase FemA/FemB family protein [Candidatus Schekmanbacteria bacterium]|nr:peptidoglycan bridge formation glycyltransferase FemA/FemB family protein [Candidatus Schekmanbacteria bacterium]